MNSNCYAASNLKKDHKKIKRFWISVVFVRMNAVSKNIPGIAETNQEKSHHYK